MSEPQTGGEMPRHLDLRKYPNRRYYDSSHSRHLTLEEIRTLVRDGCDIKVTDSKTGADITAQVLTQIILELETPKLETFPVNMLVQMIRANERVVGDFIQKYFQQAFTAYLDYHRQMEERFRQMQHLPGTLNPFAAWAPGMLNPFIPPAAAPSGPAAPTQPPQESADLKSMVAKLQQEIAALQQHRRPKKQAKKKIVRTQK